VALKFRKYLFIIFLLLGLGAAQASAASFFDSLKNLFSVSISNDILDKINENIIGYVKAKNIRFIIPNKLELEDIEILDEAQEKVLFSPHIKASVSLISLLTSNIKISEAIIESPVFNYKIKNAVHNVVNLFNSPPGIFGPPKESDRRVSINRVYVKNGQFLMSHDAGVIIKAYNIQASGKFWVEKGPFGIDVSELSIAHGLIQAAGMDLPITNLRTHNVFISDEKVSTPDLKAIYEKAQVSANGTVYIKKNYYDVNAYINAPKNTYPRGLTKLFFIPPAFTAQTHLSGALTEPIISTKIATKEAVINNLLIKKSNLDVNITTQAINIKSSDFVVGANGVIQATGQVDLDRHNFNFSTIEKNISIKDILNIFEFKLNSEGSINAQTNLSGSFGAKNHVYKIKSQGKVLKGQLDKITLGTETNFDVTADYILDDKVLIRQASISDNWNLKLNMSGIINLKNKSYDFKYNMSSNYLKYYLSKISPLLDAHKIKAQGTLGYDKKLYAQGTVQAANIIYDSYAASDFEADFDMANDNLEIRRAHAWAYDGLVHADFSIQDIYNSKKLGGTTSFEQLNLARLPKDLLKFPVSGLLKAAIKWSGTLKNPNLKFDARVIDGSLDELALPNVITHGSFDRNILTLEQLSVEGFSGFMKGEQLSYDNNSEILRGELLLQNFSLSAWFAKYAEDLKGIIDGTIKLGGKLKSPQISAFFNAQNIKYRSHEFGSGPFSIILQRENLIINQAKTNETDLVVSLSSALSNKNSRTNLQLAFALTKKTINAQAELTNFIFDSSQLSSTPRIGVKGELSASVHVSGLIEDLEVEADIVSPRYSFFDPTKRNLTNKILKEHGPATLVAELKNGHLGLNFMAGLGEQQEGILVSLDGPCRVNSCDLDLHGIFNYDHWDDIFINLKNELAQVAASFVVDAKLSKTKSTSWKTKATIQLDNLKASMPAIPNVSLLEPVLLSYADEKITIHKQGNLKFYPGVLEISGTIGSEFLDTKLRGAIPIILFRFVAPIIQRAEGLATGNLHITGSIAEPVLDGQVAIDPGSEVTFNKYLESLEFKEGLIVFDKTSPKTYSTKFKNIKITLGDGRIYLNGIINKFKNIFNIFLEGSNIVLKDQGQFIESDFNLRTVKNSKDETTLKGNVAITDGLVHRQFDLRNFVARAAQTSDVSNSKLISNLDLNLDLDIAIRQFRASARMLNIDVDTNLIGQIKASGPIQALKYGGSLSVSEGKITFPATTFDLYESRIDLDEYAQSGFKPKFSIVTSQEFSQEEFPIQRDTTIQLSLTGDVDQLKLELKPISGDMKLSQGQIFLMLLKLRGFNSNAQEEFRVNAQKAAMALSGEVFLRPLTNELAELLESQTKTRFQFGSALEPGGVTLRMNWKIGPRIEAYGAYMYFSDDNRRRDVERKSFMIDSYPVGNLGLKLILFDHKPFGPLFLESSFGANRLRENSYEPRGLFKLTYRILSK
jgi:hypothetical protein